MTALQTKNILRCILQMMYQPKSIGRMADSEKLTLCISLNSSLNMYLFMLRLSYRVLYLYGKKFDSQLSSVFKLNFLPTPCYYWLDVT